MGAIYLYIRFNTKVILFSTLIHNIYTLFIYIEVELHITDRPLTIHHQKKCMIWKL